MNELFFDKAAGIKVQHEQLAKMKPRLSPECYAVLEARCNLENSRLAHDACGYDVFRGSDLDGVVNNWKPTIPPLAEVNAAREALRTILNTNGTTHKLKLGKILEYAFIQGWVAAKGYQLPFFQICVMSGRSILD